MFSRLVTNGVTVDIFQTSKGRKIINGKRVKRYTNKSRSFTWNGRATGNKRLSDGVYYIRVRILDANKRIDSGGSWSSARTAASSSAAASTTTPAAASLSTARPPLGGRAGRLQRVQRPVSP